MTDKAYLQRTNNSILQTVSRALDALICYILGLIIIRRALGIVQCLTAWWPWQNPILNYGWRATIAKGVRSIIEWFWNRTLSLYQAKCCYLYTTSKLTAWYYICISNKIIYSRIINLKTNQRIVNIETIKSTKTYNTTFIIIRPKRLKICNAFWG